MKRYQEIPKTILERRTRVAEINGEKGDMTFFIYEYRMGEKTESRPSLLMGNQGAAA